VGGETEGVSPPPPPPRKQVLNVLIAYWYYGTSKPMLLCNHLAEPSLPYSKVAVREEE
jgi:hypothetical protein